MIYELVVVAPMRYLYENRRFFAVSNKDGTKVRSLKKNTAFNFLLIALIEESAAGWGTGANSDIGRSAKLAS
jgi:hypothetical protein